MSKQEAIELGEADGEAAAKELFAKGGVDALASTLVDGAETWEADARSEKLAAGRDVDEDFRGAYYRVFARGARRVAEAIVTGEADGQAGKDFGNCLRRMNGVNRSVVEVYADAYKRGAEQRAAAASEPGAVVNVSVPTVNMDLAPRGPGG